MSAPDYEVADYTPNVALVTGAAQGIGREIALRLANDGFDVAVNDIPPKLEQLQKVVDEIKAKGRRSVAVTADISNEEQVANMIEKTVEALGGLDAMIANAGISGGGPFLETDTNAWDRQISINLRGTMLCYKYAGQQMVKQKRGGRIVGASSILGKRAGLYLAAYSASKFAVRGLSQSVAKELAPFKITVNTYAPGCILTDLVDHPLDSQYGGRGAFSKIVAGAPPDAPDAGPEVVASTVSYIVKPEAYFITGQSISMNGGTLFD